MDPRILICYSTQSGTSETLSERFYNDLNERTGIEGLSIVKNISEFEENFNEFNKFEIVLFFISSYGEGEPCDDGINFFKNFQQNVKNLKLKYYSLFGCGNSFYDQYQAVSIKLKELLDSNNLIQIGEFGKSNEANNNIIDDFDSWEFDYLPILANFLKIKLIEVFEYKPVYELIEIKEVNRTRNNNKPPFQELKPFETDINLNDVNKFGDNYIHLNINLYKEKSKIKFESGDHIGIYPKNDINDVNELIEILNIKEDKPFKILSINRMNCNKLNNKEFKSIKEFLINEIEINNVLSRKLIKDLIKYFINENSLQIRSKLNELIKSKEIFKDQVINKKLTLIKLFKNLKIRKESDYKNIPISFLIENFGILKPRYFSISNSGLIEKDFINILIKLIKDNDNHFEGVLSKTIENILNIEINNKISIFIKKSKFKLPSNLNKPIIFVCAGSGIAPFRGFLQEICNSQFKLKQLDKIILYFGIRELNNDFFVYREDINKFKEILGEKLDIKIAISTVNKNNLVKMYVQDLIKLDSNLISEYLIEKNGLIYVCGDAGGMSRGVKKVIVDIIGDKKGGGDVKKGDQYVQYLQNMGRYKEDVW